MVVMPHSWMPTPIKLNRRRRLGQGWMYTYTAEDISWWNMVGEEMFLSGALVMDLIFNKFARQFIFL